MNIKIDFYDDFHCKMGACQHTCCAGWEIDIDEISLHRFLSYDGAFGEKMKRCITVDDGEFHFVTDERERCPFLQENGLCELILEKGEDALSDICSLHPRFFFEMKEHWFSGLGMACEAVSERIVKVKQDELFFFVDEERMRFSEMLESLFGETIDVSSELSFEGLSCTLEIAKKTEPINAAWEESLQSLSAAYEAGKDEMNSRLTELVKSTEGYHLAVRLFQYILYRDLEHLEAYGMPLIIEYAKRNTTLILLMGIESGDFSDAARRWSEQMEYAVENVELFHEELEEGY